MTTDQQRTRQAATHPREAGRLTINEAALTTGWSSRMLRYIDELGLVTPPRSDGGYRMYGGGELQRLRTLRELLDRHQVSLTDLGFAVRLRDEPGTRSAVESWIDAPAEPPAVLGAEPADASAWLRFEQDKHQRLLAAVLRRPAQRVDAPPHDVHPEGSQTSVKESA